MKNLIAQAFVINLNRRTDRLAHFQRQCLEQRLPFPVERVSAIQKGRLTPEESLNLAHLYLWGRAAAVEGITLIFEDDVIFCRDFGERLSSQTDTAPDGLLYLGASWVAFNEPVGGWARLRTCCGTFAYLVTPDLAARLVRGYARYNPTHRIMVDNFLTLFCRRENVPRWMVYPSWVTFVDEPGDLYPLSRSVGDPRRKGDHFAGS